MSKAGFYRFVQTVSVLIITAPANQHNLLS